MGAALLILLLVFLFPFFVLFVASGFLLCLKPQGIRPPWWDWGMDEPKPAVEVEPAPEVQATSEVSAAPETEAKQARPRW